MASEPFLLAQLSDPHISDEDDGPGVALAAGVRAVAALDPAPGAVLVSGDLAEHGSASEYRRARELLSALTMPVHVLAGNHDDRAALRKAFPLPLAVADAPSEDYRYVTRCGPLRLVGCDTTQPGRDDGAFAAERLAWLEARLTEDRDTPTVVAMHHLPLPTGIPAMDALGLPRADRVAIDELVAAFPHVGLLVAGHVHRAVVGTLGGCAVFACPSTHLQLVLDLREPTRIAVVPEPPAFGLHVAVAGELVSHLQPVGDWSSGAKGPP
jgi:3',5'-cyclic AMP phosphodiesterase CpdA